MGEKTNANGPVGGMACSPFVGQDVDSFIAPIYAHFGMRAFHVRNARGEWAAARLVKDMRTHLIRSVVEVNSDLPPADAEKLRRLLFHPLPDVFVLLEFGLLGVYAASHEEATRQLAELMARYRETSNPAPHFQILSTEYGAVRTEAVSLTESGLMEPDDLALHYGNDFPAWESELARLLCARRCGVSILRGEPGTGKTTFLRHLVHRLRGTHRFFYVPVTHQSLLSTPDMAGFWVQQNQDFPKHHSVILLEDSEALLEERHPVNRGNMANLLNISDGLLGDFLKVQVICTLNCTVDRLDPALMRVGRLLACRQFRRLTREEARRLAKAKGISLKDQPDYSLAEIYHQRMLGGDPTPARKVGFAGLH